MGTQISVLAQIFKNFCASISVFLPLWTKQSHLCARKNLVRLTKLPRRTDFPISGGGKRRARVFNAFSTRKYTTKQSALLLEQVVLLILYAVYLLTLCVCCRGRCTAVAMYVAYNYIRYQVSADRWLIWR